MGPQQGHSGFGHRVKQSNLSYRKLTAGQEGKVAEGEFWAKGASEKCCRGPSGGINQPKGRSAGGAGRKSWIPDVDSNQMGGVGRRKTPGSR